MDDADDAATLVERLARLEDVVEIQQLFVDYGRKCDEADHAGYAALFAEHGEVDLGPHGAARGRDAIRELMEGTSGPPGSSFRIISNPRVELDGDRATAGAMFTVFVRDAEGMPKVVSLGFHSDELVREEGRWRFARRTANIEIPRRT
jgi:3-phenylpropionate/cinnamic acid dioxygenase small subunit